MTNENLCYIFIFFSEHRKMKKENLCQILIFQKNEKMKICGQFSSFFFFSGLITEMKLIRK